MKRLFTLIIALSLFALALYAEIVVPQNLTSTWGDMEITLSWEAPVGDDNIDGYNVYARYKDDGNDINDQEDWELYGTLNEGGPLDDLSFILDANDEDVVEMMAELSPTIQIAVIAVIDGDDGTDDGEEITSWTSITFQTGFPAPTALVSTPGDWKVDLSWTAPTLTGRYDALETSHPLAGYIVSYANGNAVPTKVFKATAAATIEALVNGLVYDFEVIAVYGDVTDHDGDVEDILADNDIEISEPLTGTGTPAVTLYTIPTITTVVPVTADDKIVVTWTAPTTTTETLAAYLVYRATVTNDVTGAYTAIGFTADDVVTYDDVSAAGNVITTGEYRYEVRAVYGTLTIDQNTTHTTILADITLTISDPSNSPAAVTLEEAVDTTPAPTALTAVQGYAQITLNWLAPADAPSDLAGYYIYAGTATTPIHFVAQPTVTKTITATNYTPVAYKVTAVYGDGADYTDEAEHIADASDVYTESVELGPLTVMPTYVQPRTLNGNVLPGEINLTWQAPNPANWPELDGDGEEFVPPTVTAYIIYRFDTPVPAVWGHATADNTKAIGYTLGTVRTYKDEIANADVDTYTYYVTAIYGDLGTATTAAAILALVDNTAVFESGFSNARELTALPKDAYPPVPDASFTATAGNAQVVLAWGQSAYEGDAARFGYIIYRYEDEDTDVGTPDIPVARVFIPQTAGVEGAFTYPYTGLTNDTEYKFEIAAVYGTGTYGTDGDYEDLDDVLEGIAPETGDATLFKSAPTVAKTATPGVPPATPTLLAATSTTTAVNLSWTAPDPATFGGKTLGGYLVYRWVSTMQNIPDTHDMDNDWGAVLDLVRAPAVIFSDGTVSAGTEYKYYVTAVYGTIATEDTKDDVVVALWHGSQTLDLVESGFSNGVVKGPLTYPTPTGLVAFGGDEEVTLKWNPAATGSEPLIGYLVYKYGDYDDEETTADTAEAVGFKVAPDTTYTDADDLENGETYKYYITAIYGTDDDTTPVYVTLAAVTAALEAADNDDLTESAKTADITAIPNVPNPAPTDVTAEAGHYTVDLTWVTPTDFPTGNAELYGYRVYYNYEMFPNYWVGFDEFDIADIVEDSTPVTTASLQLDPADFPAGNKVAFALKALYGTIDDLVESALSLPDTIKVLDLYPPIDLDSVEVTPVAGVEGSVKIAWPPVNTTDVVADLWGYLVSEVHTDQWGGYVYSGPAKAFVRGTVSALPDTSVVIANLDLESQYYFTVQAIYGEATVTVTDIADLLAKVAAEDLHLSLYTNPQGIILPSDYPKPINVVAMPGDEEVMLTWAAPDLTERDEELEPLFGYVLYKYTGDTPAPIEFYELDDDLEYLDDDNLTNMVEYKYHIIAVYGEDDEENPTLTTLAAVVAAIGETDGLIASYPAIVTAMPFAETDIPAPSGLVLKQQVIDPFDGLTVSIEWDNPVYSTPFALPLQRFAIYVDDEDIESDVYMWTNAEKISYHFSLYNHLLDYDTEYEVYVVAKYGLDLFGSEFVESAHSNTLTFTTPEAPPAPPTEPVTLLTYTLSGYDVTLGWTEPWSVAPESFIGYAVKRYPITLANYITHIATGSINDYELTGTPVELDLADTNSITDEDVANGAYIYSVVALYEGADIEEDPSDILESDEQRIVVTIKTISTLPYTENFDNEFLIAEDLVEYYYPFSLEGWSSFTGDLGATTTTIDQGFLWGFDTGMGGTDHKLATGLDIINGWYVSPSIRFTTATSLALSFNLSLLSLVADGEVPAYDYKFAVVISTDNGVTWNEAGVKKLWSTEEGAENDIMDIDEDGEVHNIILADANNPLDLGVGGAMKIAFYAWSDADITAENYYGSEIILFIDDLQLEGAVSEENPIVKPAVTMLNSNYPNPFNPETTISFSVNQDSRVSIDVYNVKGQKVKNLVNDVRTAGQHSVVWNGKDANGRDVASGIYFYQMKADGYTATKKMILMK